MASHLRPHHSRDYTWYRSRRTELLLGTMLASVCLGSASADADVTAKGRLGLVFRGVWQESADSRSRDLKSEPTAKVLEELSQNAKLELLSLQCDGDKPDSLCGEAGTAAIVKYLEAKGGDWAARALVTTAEPPQPPSAPQCQVAMGLIRREAKSAAGEEPLLEQRRSPPIDCNAPAAVVAAQVTKLLQTWMNEHLQPPEEEQRKRAMLLNERREKLNKASIALLAIGVAEGVTAGLFSIHVAGPMFTHADKSVYASTQYLPPALSVTFGVASGLALIGALGCYLAKPRSEPLPAKTAQLQRQLAKNQ